MTDCGRVVGGGTNRASMYIEDVSTSSPENRSKQACGTTTLWNMAERCVCFAQRRSGSLWPWGSLSRYVADSGSFSQVGDSSILKPNVISGADTGTEAQV